MAAVGWIGFDLDGTLAVYDGWRGESHIGDPVAPMVRLVRLHLRQGVECRIFTARVFGKKSGSSVHALIESWCLRHIGCVLPITCSKDPGMIDLYDDRCHRVETNTGRVYDCE